MSHEINQKPGSILISFLFNNTVLISWQCILLSTRYHLIAYVYDMYVMYMHIEFQINVKNNLSEAGTETAIKKKCTKVTILFYL